jgi:hypothetical protein
MPVNLEDDIIEPIQPRQVYGMDDLIHACTRPTYVQPIKMIHKRYPPSFCTQWLAEETAFTPLAYASRSVELRVTGQDER